MNANQVHRAVLNDIELLVLLITNKSTGVPESRFIPNQNNKLKLVNL